MKVLFEAEYNDDSGDTLFMVKVGTNPNPIYEVPLQGLSFHKFNALNNFIKLYGDMCRKQESNILIKELEHIIYRLKEE